MEGKRNMTYLKEEGWIHILKAARLGVRETEDEDTQTLRRESLEDFCKSWTAVGRLEKGWLA